MRTTTKYLFTILTLITCRLSSQSTDKSDDEVMGRVSSTNYADKTNFAIKTDVLTPVVNYLLFNRPTVCLSLERGFSYRHAIQLTGQYGTFFQHNYTMPLQYAMYGPFINWTTDISQTRAELILDYKYYLKDSNDFKGFYCGLYVRGIDYTNWFYTMRGEPAIGKYTRDYIGFCGGATIGYQTFIKDHLVIDFLFGLGVRNVFCTPSPYDNIHALTDADIPAPLRTPLSIDIRTTINIGYKF